MLSQNTETKSQDVGKQFDFSPNIHLHLRIRIFPDSAYGRYSQSFPTYIGRNT